MDEIFIDASFWIALVVGSDLNHRSARRIWQPLMRRDHRTATTNWTLYEALTFLNSRRRHDIALGLLEMARRSSTIVDASTIEKDVIDVFSSHEDKQWSVVDCANFICIRQRQITWALSYDRDFVQAQSEFNFTLLGSGASS